MVQPLVLRLQGEFDIYRCDELERILEPALDVPRVVVDLRGVRYIDSSCLAVLIRIRKARAAKGYAPAVFVKGPKQVQTVLQVTQLDQLWQQYDSFDEAVEAARRIPDPQ